MMREDVMNYVMGHEPSKEGDRCRHIPFDVTAPWISLLPRFDVSGPALAINRSGSVDAIAQLLAKKMELTVRPKTI
jgi:hypothetical protein